MIYGHRLISELDSVSWSVMVYTVYSLWISCGRRPMFILFVNGHSQSFASQGRKQPWLMHYVMYEELVPCRLFMIESLKMINNFLNDVI